MKLIKLLLLLAILPAAAIRCEDEDPSFVQLSYRTLDSSGNASNRFNEGENFVISLKITNSSSEELFYTRNHESNEDFAMVFRLSGSRGEKIGKPFPLQYPGATREGGHFIEPNSSIEYAFPWVYDESLYKVPSSGGYWDVNGEYPYNTTPLAKGRYEISFTEDFLFSLENDNQIKINNRSLSNTFTIE